MAEIIVIAVAIPGAESGAGEWRQRRQKPIEVAGLSRDDVSRYGHEIGWIRHEALGNVRQNLRLEKGASVNVRHQENFKPGHNGRPAHRRNRYIRHRETAWKLPAIGMPQAEQVGIDETRCQA